MNAEINVTTEAEYLALPPGSIVAALGFQPWVKRDNGK